MNSTPLSLSVSGTDDPNAVQCVYKTEKDCVMKFTYSEHANGQSVLTALKEPGQYLALHDYFCKNCILNHSLWGSVREEIVKVKEVIIIAISNANTIYNGKGCQLNILSYIMAMHLCIYRMCCCPKCHDGASGSCVQYLVDGHLAASPLETGHHHPRPPRVFTLPKCTFTGAL